MAGSCDTSDHAFDYAIVGSGFGGSVAALRLSQKGYRVVVIEAGKRWAPEDFPKTNWLPWKYLWRPGWGWRGPQRMSLFRHALVLSGVGVGGGSLVYGNTLFKPRKEFFDSPCMTAVDEERRFAPFYDLARKMLGTVPNPRLVEVDRLLKETAAEYGREHTFTPSPVGVYFGEPGIEVPDPYFAGEGPARTGCTSCGGCFLGCRIGAKNTLDHNYLYLAEALGAEVWPETKVEDLRALGPRGSDGYELRLRSTHGLFPRARRLRVKRVVMAAGVLGTIELLLRSKRSGGLSDLSPLVGHEVRTNSEAVVGARCRARDRDLSHGIAASSSVFPDDVTQVQADRYPAGADALAPMTTLMVDGGGRVPRWLRFIGTVLRHPIDFLRTAWPFGFARQTVILVVMQTLDNQLRMSLRRRWWFPLTRRLQSHRGPEDGAPTYIPIANEFARRMAKKLDAVPIASVTEVLADIPITAHILGGSIIGTGTESGVVDSRHRAFGYDGLLVCDGSVIPANLGANPALSITAFAERALSFVPTKHGTLRHLKVDTLWGTSPLISGDSER